MRKERHAFLDDEIMPYSLVSRILNKTEKEIKAYEIFLQNHKIFTHEELINQVIHVVYHNFASPITEKYTGKLHCNGLRPFFIGLYDAFKTPIYYKKKIVEGHVTNPRDGWKGTKACTDLDTEIGVIGRAFKGEAQDLGHILINDVEEEEKKACDSHYSCDPNMRGTELVIPIPSIPFTSKDLRYLTSSSTYKKLLGASFNQTFWDFDVNWKYAFTKDHVEQITTMLEPYNNLLITKPSFIPDPEKTFLEIKI
jgi:hypothetical protein